LTIRASRGHETLSEISLVAEFAFSSV
jgi:hypothetical protein